MSVKFVLSFFDTELLKEFETALAIEDETLRCDAVFSLFAKHISNKDLDEEEERALFIAKQCALRSRDATQCVRLCSIMKGSVDEGVCSFYHRLHSDYVFDTNMRAKLGRQYIATQPE